jgi:hypothetical protein
VAFHHIAHTWAALQQNGIAVSVGLLVVWFALDDVLVQELGAFVGEPRNLPWAVTSPAFYAA